MGSFAIFHWLIVLAIIVLPLGGTVLVVWLLMKLFHARSAGDDRDSDDKGPW